MYWSKHLNVTWLLSVLYKDVWISSLKEIRQNNILYLWVVDFVKLEYNKTRVISYYMYNLLVSVVACMYLLHEKKNMFSLENGIAMFLKCFSHFVFNISIFIVGIHSSLCKCNCRNNSIWSLWSNTGDCRYMWKIQPLAPRRCE